MVARIAGALAVRNLKDVVEPVPVEVCDTEGLGRVLYRELIDRPETDSGARQCGEVAVGVLDRRDHVRLAVVVEVTNIGKMRRHRLTVGADRLELDRCRRNLCSGFFRRREWHSQKSQHRQRCNAYGSSTSHAILPHAAPARDCLSIEARFDQAPDIARRSK